MDIVTALLTLPYAPVRAATSLMKTLERQAETQLYDPANVRRELEELDEAFAAGLLSADEHALAQQQILDRLMTAPGRPGTSGTGETGQPGLVIEADEQAALPAAPSERAAPSGPGGRPVRRSRR